MLDINFCQEYLKKIKEWRVKGSKTEVEKIMGHRVL